MDARFSKVAEQIDLAKVLGYLNFSNGKPDVRFQSAWNDAQQLVAQFEPTQPWQSLSDWLIAQSPLVGAQKGSAFQNLHQAQHVLTLLNSRFIPEYRRFHHDILGHLTPQELLQPLLVVKMLETLLAQSTLMDEPEKAVGSAVLQLNDFLGYRPVATLENKQLGEAYPHEFFRPIPVYLKELGAGHGPYEGLILEAIGVLRSIPFDLLEEASFDLSRLEEWAYDPRNYDHSHPVNRRPNYVFGEWDPQRLDQSGYYRRYVTRAITLQILQQRVAAESGLLKQEYLKEAGIVLAGTVLMASAMSGHGPGSLDSGVKLATLVPRIAKLRDNFYNHCFNGITGHHQKRLSEESERLRQPFAGARQHLNQSITKHRAEQLQIRHVAYFLADIGASHQARERLPANMPASDRFQIEIKCMLAEADAAIEKNDHLSAANQLAVIETCIKRGIDCGALPDPWNALGFQAQFPIFQSMEDAVLDHRLIELCESMEAVFQKAGRVVCEAAASGHDDIVSLVMRNTKKLALWWDQFATNEVSDLPKVSGEEFVQSTSEVAEALSDWHKQGATAGDLSFWRQHLQRFHTASSFSSVVDVLLHRGDFFAAMSLLINWLSHASEVPLEDGRSSFFELMMQWTLEVMDSSRLTAVDRWKYLKRFFDLLEANADEYWDLSAIELNMDQKKEGQDNPFAAAYEGMEYRDSTDDGNESSLADESARKIGEDFPLEHQVENITQRFRFLAHVAQLWRLIARQSVQFRKEADPAESLLSWWKAASQQQEQLMPLLARIQQCVVPEPIGNQVSMMEYDRQRSMKERLLETGISATLDVALAERSLLAAYYTIQDQEVPPTEANDWERTAVQLENLIWRGETTSIGPLLDKFLDSLANVSLLYKPLDAGGDLGDIYRTRTAQNILRDLMNALPRIGHIRETYQVLKVVRDIERSQSVQGRVVTEFNRLFEFAMLGIALSVARSSLQWTPRPEPSRLVNLLDQLAKPFLFLWMDHSHSVRLSSLEAIHSDEDWRELRDFIRKYGSELFHPKFMTLANLRAILSRGVHQYLGYLEEELAFAGRDDSIPGAKLIEALNRNRITRDVAVKNLELVMKAIVENYEEYKDYNATTTQSDYGENLFRLLSFLRLKSTYERHIWNIKPLIWIHEALSREGHGAAALLWKQTIARMTADIARRNVDQLRVLQSENGMQLRTVADLVEEKFLVPMEIDRLASLVAPAVDELNEREQAKQSRETSEQSSAMKSLLTAIDVQLRTTSGSGLDVPVWIRKLEQEGEFVLEQQTIEKWLEPPFRVIAENELENWEKGQADNTLLPG